MPDMAFCCLGGIFTEDRIISIRQNFLKKNPERKNPKQTEFLEDRLPSRCDLKNNPKRKKSLADRTPRGRNP